MKKKITIFMGLAIIICSSLTPLRALAVDTDFFSSNDILFYNPDDGTCDPASSDSYETPVKADSIKKFLDAYGQIAFDVGKKYGLPYEAILAQAILESGWGGSGLTQKANNFFGVKASGAWKGEVINMRTGEVYNGQSTTITAGFRKYPSPQVGWDDYGKFITENPRYKKALNYPNDPIAYIKEVAAAGYATSPTYAKSVIGLINSITKYIKSTGQWTPSSSSSGSGSGTTATPTTGCGGGDSSGVADPGDSSQPANTQRIDKGWSLKDNTDYSGTQCASGTTDKGTYKHPTRGFTIRKCETKSVGIVASIISQRTVNMIAAAKGDGVTLAGSGFRSYEEQKSIYDSRGCPCSGLVATPGNSNHERGLAIDFSRNGNSLGTNDPEHKWLDSNGNKYGFINYPREAWHYSMSGA